MLAGALQGIGEYRAVSISLIGQQAVRLPVGASLAAASAGVGALLSVLGRTRPDVTLTFAEFGLYVAGLGALHLCLYAGLIWQVSRLSRRPRPLPADAPAEST